MIAWFACLPLLLVSNSALERAKLMSQRPSQQNASASIHLVSPMIFPVLNQTNATKEGAFCSANGRKNKKKAKRSLCPKMRGYPAEFEIKGKPKSYVTVQLQANEHKQGLNFSIDRKTTKLEQRVRIKKDGFGSFLVGGRITLQNAQATEVGEYTFKLHVTVLYQ